MPRRNRIPRRIRPTVGFRVYREARRATRVRLALGKRNLIGPPERLIQQLRALEAAGAQHIGLIFLGETFDELMDDMDLFAKGVLPAFTA